MDVFDKLLAPRKHNGAKDSMFVCDDELGKQYTMAVVRKGGLADNRRQALLQVSRLFGCGWRQNYPAMLSVRRPCARDAAPPHHYPTVGWCS